MTKPSREEYEDVAYIIDNGGTLTGRGRQVAAAALRIAAEQVVEREKVVAEFGHGDWDAPAHVRFLRDSGGGSCGYTADLIERLYSALQTAGDHSTATPVSPPGGGT